jgi:hypothetical protein
MRLLPQAFAAVAILLGAWCLELSFGMGEASWRLLETPLPPPGMATAANFQVSKGGRFQVEVTIPDTADPNDVHLPQRPAVSGLLQLDIQREGGASARHEVKLCRYSGRYYFGGVDYYSCDKEFRLDPGSYTARLTPVADFALFRKNGAVLTVARVAEPSGWAVFSMLYRTAGFVLLGVAVLVLLANIGVQRFGRPPAAAALSQDRITTR